MVWGGGGGWSSKPCQMQEAKDEVIGVMMYEALWEAHLSQRRRENPQIATDIGGVNDMRPKTDSLGG